MRNIGQSIVVPMITPPNFVGPLRQPGQVMESMVRLDQWLIAWHLFEVMDL